MITFLIDENLSPVLVPAANAFGHAAFHINHRGWTALPDPPVLHRVLDEDLTLVTHNWDDFRPMLRRAAVHAGVVVILPNVRRERQIVLFTAALEAIRDHEPPIDMVNTVLEVDAGERWCDTPYPRSNSPRRRSGSLRGTHRTRKAAARRTIRRAAALSPSPVHYFVRITTTASEAPGGRRGEAGEGRGGNAHPHVARPRARRHGEGLRHPVRGVAHGQRVGAAAPGPGVVVQCRENRAEVPTRLGGVGTAALTGVPRSPQAQSASDSPASTARARSR